MSTDTLIAFSTFAIIATFCQFLFRLDDCFNRRILKEVNCTAVRMISICAVLEIETVGAGVCRHAIILRDGETPSDGPMHWQPR